MRQFIPDYKLSLQEFVAEYIDLSPNDEHWEAYLTARWKYLQKQATWHEVHEHYTKTKQYKIYKQ